MRRRDVIKSISKICLAFPYLFSLREDPNVRILELKVKDRWIRSNMGKLKIGDTFRLFEPDGKIVQDREGKIEFTVKSSPYKNNNGVWGVVCA